MADEGQDQDQKTEDPTQKRLEEARKKGQIVSSREINHLFLLGVMALMIAWAAAPLMHSAKLMLLPFIERPHDFDTSTHSIGVILRDIWIDSSVVLLIPVLATVAAALAAGILQTGFNVSGEPVIPKLEKISPLKGLKKMFSLRSVAEFVKGILKLIIVSLVAWKVVSGDLLMFKTLPNHEVEGLLVFLLDLTTRIMVGVCIAMFFIALLDYLYQRYEFMKSMRMSKQEIKDEYKQQEGDPIIKQRLRQLRMERARKRMMASVPSADVVITNPTHYSVALKYDSGKMQAPSVVAKGADFIALKIREIARENDVPLVENPPLARALYAAVDIDEEIPFEHYKAVAEIISYVYQLKGRKA